MINLIDKKIITDECFNWCKDAHFTFLNNNILYIPILIIVTFVAKSLLLVFWDKIDFYSYAKKWEFMKYMDYFSLFLMVGYLIQVYFLIN